jgi:hypothetical protein
MVYRGQIKNGVVVLENATGLTEGTKVTVRPASIKPSMKSNGKSNSKRRRSTLTERLAPVIGKARTLPADAAVNLDHYLYGLPKRK